MPTDLSSVRRHQTRKGRKFIPKGQVDGRPRLSRDDCLGVSDLKEATFSVWPQWAELRLEGVSPEDAICLLREEHSSGTT